MMYNERIEELQRYFKAHNEYKVYPGHSSKVHSVGWSCDGKRLASASFDKTVCVYVLHRDNITKETVFKGHAGSVDQLSWHQSNANLLSTASVDKSVRIWDTRQSKCAAVIPTKGENINITWSPNGDTIAVGSKVDLLTFIDTRTNKIVTEEQYTFEVNEISWNNTGDLFFLTTGQGNILVLSYPDLETQHVINAHSGNCICIKFDPTGKYFAIGSADSLVSLWDINELACRRVFNRMDWPVRSISFSHDGQLLVSASEDLIIDIGFTETGEKVAEFSVTAPTFTVACHPSQYLVAYACDDKDTYDRKREAGILKIWGFPSDI